METTKFVPSTNPFKKKTIADQFEFDKIKFESRTVACAQNIE